MKFLDPEVEKAANELIERARKAAHAGKAVSYWRAIDDDKQASAEAKRRARRILEDQ